MGVWQSSSNHKQVGTRTTSPIKQKFLFIKKFCLKDFREEKDKEKWEWNKERILADRQYEEVHTLVHTLLFFHSVCVCVCNECISGMHRCLEKNSWEMGNTLPSVCTSKSTYMDEK